MENWQKSFFKNLSPHVLKEHVEQNQLRSLIKNDILFEQGDEVCGLFFNEDGLIKVVQKDILGKVVFARLSFPGDTIGHRSIFIEKSYKGTAIVVSDQASVYFIPTEKITLLLNSNAEFAKELIVKISEELNRSEVEKIELRSRSSFSRLCLLLLNLFENYSVDQHTKKILCADLTKVELAQLLGSANETIIRHMSDLKIENVIGSQGKRYILLDSEKLIRMSQS